MQNWLSYSSQTPPFPEFFSLLLASYFSKKIASKIGAALYSCFNLRIKWVMPYLGYPLLEAPKPLHQLQHTGKCHYYTIRKHGHVLGHIIT